MLQLPWQIFTSRVCRMLSLEMLVAIVFSFTETKMSSFWRNLHHWLHWKLSKWQLSVQPVMKISSKWQHFRFSVRVRNNEIHKTRQTFSFWRNNNSISCVIYLIQCKTRSVDHHEQWFKQTQNWQRFCLIWKAHNKLWFWRQALSLNLQPWKRHLWSCDCNRCLVLSCAAIWHFNTGHELRWKKYCYLPTMLGACSVFRGLIATWNKHGSFATRKSFEVATRERAGRVPLVHVLPWQPFLFGCS